MSSKQRKQNAYGLQGSSILRYYLMWLILDSKYSQGMSRWYNLHRCHELIAPQNH